MASKSELSESNVNNINPQNGSPNSATTAAPIKKQKVSKSMDDEKTKDNSNETRFNIYSSTSSSVPSLSANSHSNPVNHKKRSFIKNSKLTPNSYKLTQSRPEKKNSNKDLLPFDNEKVLQNMIQCQIEYLFSNYHLENDTYLLARMQDTKMHWLSVDEILHNQKIRQLTSDKSKVVRALRNSKYLQLSSDHSRVRRPDFIVPKLPPNRDLRRTVFLYGIPCNKPENDLRIMLCSYGNIKRIHFEKLQSIDLEAPNQEVSQLIMRKKYLFPPRGGNHHSYDSSDTESIASMSSVGSKFSDLSMMMNPNGNVQDFSHLTSCFVVFESQSQATKCVKHRVRAPDGMRAIHKYDYNKVAKKYRIAQMKGEKLSFSPPPTSITQAVNAHQRNNRSASPVSSNYRQQIHNNNSSSSRSYQSYRSQPNMSSPQPVNNRFSGWNGRTNRANYNNHNGNNGYNNNNNRSKQQQQQQQPRRNRLGSRKDRSSYDNNQAVVGNDDKNHNKNGQNRHRGGNGYNNMGMYQSKDFGKRDSTKQWKRSNSNKVSQSISPHPKIKREELPQSAGNLKKSVSELPKLKLNASAPQIMRSQSAQPQTSKKQQSPAPKLYNPIPDNTNNKTKPSLPSQADIAALKAAGYNHDLNFLVDCNDTLNDIANDPLFDKYFGFDGHGKSQSVSTQQAAQSLTKETTNSVLYQQQRTSSTYQQSSTTSTSSSTTSSSAYYQQQQYQQQQKQTSAPVFQQPSSYSAPRSAPFRPVSTPQNVATNYQSQQWQLDNLKRQQQNISNNTAAATNNKDTDK